MTEKIPGEKKITALHVNNALVLTVIKMLRVFISPFIDDGCCLRMWSLHPILPVEYNFTEAQSKIG